MSINYKISNDCKELFTEYYENKGPGPLTESMKNNI